MIAALVLTQLLATAPEPNANLGTKGQWYVLANSALKLNGDHRILSTNNAFLQETTNDYGTFGINAEAGAFPIGILSLGGRIGLDINFGDQANQESLTIGPSIGAAIPLATNLHLWPRLEGGFSATWVKPSDATTTISSLGGFVALHIPLLVNITSNVGLQIGPYVRYDRGAYTIANVDVTQSDVNYGLYIGFAVWSDTPEHARAAVDMP